MNRLVLTLTCCLTLICGEYANYALGQDIRSQDIEWQADLGTARNLARHKNKLILLHFSAEWCRPCKQLDTFVFSSERVAKAINERVIPVHLDSDEHPKLVKQFSVDEIPMDVVITTSGRVIAKRSSPKDADNYVRMLEKLPSVEVAEQQGSLQLTQKIEEVLQAANDSTPSNRDMAGNNAFPVAQPTHTAPAVSPESARLAAKTASETLLVDHETTEPDAPEKTNYKTSSRVTDRVAANSKRAPAALRVINDKFFAEKSNAIENRKPGKPLQKTVRRVTSNTANGLDDNSFRPNPRGKQKLADQRQANYAPGQKKNDRENQNSQPLQVAKATIKNPFRPEAKQANPAAMDQSAARILEPDFVVKRRNATQKAKQQFASGQIRPAESDKTANNQSFQPKATANDNSNSMSARTEFVSSKRSIEKPPSTGKSTASKRISESYVLNGKCPVTLIREGKWTLGNKQFGCVHRGRVYLFASQENLDTFQKNPESFSPILAGYDPVVFHEQGELVDGHEKHGVFMGKAPSHRIVLFQSAESRAKFQANPRKFMATIKTALKQSDLKIR